MRSCVHELVGKVSQQACPPCLYSELQSLLVYTTHRISKARDVGLKFLNLLITSLPSVLCHPPLIFALLDVLTLLKRSCENEFVDEVHIYHKTRLSQRD